MEKLLIYRERFLKFLTARGRYIQSGMRFLGGTVLFYVLGELFGYTETFSQPFFIFMMGVISVFIPISALSLIFYVVIFLELLHVSLEVTLFFALVVVLYFLVYQRVFPETRIYLMMVPIFFYFQLPACLPIFAGMFCGIAGLPAILMGTVIYYLSNILQQTMNQLASGSAHGKVYSLIAARAIDNKDLLLYFVVFCLVTALVTAIRKRGAAHGWNISILAGGVVYLICMFIGGYLVNNEINITSQIGTIIGSIAIALIIQFLYNVIDYTREETFEFEDEEYYYYVRAIPKVTVEEEEFNVTQITVPSHRFSLKRKEHKQEHKEQDKEKGEENLSKFFDGLEKYIYWTSIPKIGLNDIVDILIVSVMIYLIVKWIKTTRAWVLLKGIIILLCIAFAAYLLQLHTVSWILSNTMGVGITAILIVFQPELRSALEQLGRKNWVTDIFSTDSRQEELEYTARTLQEISRAAIEMGKVKTGALIVLQREVALGEYERTGIPIDAKVSSQLLINIFEHNTPLHDGAVIIHNNRIVSATCYLPLSDSVEIGKEMGTRHRAAVGISEVSDSITVIVSEETGGISIARDGKIIRHLDPQRLRDELAVLREEKGQNKKFKLWKGRNRNEKKNGK